jgi:hypothetical protein
VRGLRQNVSRGLTCNERKSSPANTQRFGIVCCPLVSRLDGKLNRKHVGAVVLVG